MFLTSENDGSINTIFVHRNGILPFAYFSKH